MKKLVVTMTLLVAFLFTAQVSSAVEIKDMSKSHWAYQSVEYLLNKGYLVLYDDGTFRGSLPVSREVFAVAIVKLIDQIKTGEISMGAGDLAEVKKVVDAFRSELADYESQMEAFDQRLSDIESAQVVIQQDISKSMVEFRDGFDEMTDENARIKSKMSDMEGDMEELTVELDKEKKSRKSMQTMLTIGVVAAIALGASN